jgi:hypothetical protein
VCGVSGQASLPRQPGRPFRLAFARMAKHQMCQICNWEAQTWGSARPTEGRGRYARPQREAGGLFLFPPRGLPPPPSPDYAALVRLPLWALS